MAPTESDPSATASGFDIQNQIGRAKQELEHMIDMNPQCMLLVSSDGIVMRCNRALLCMLSVSGFGDVLGKSLSEVFPGWQETEWRNVLAHEPGISEGEVTLDLPEEAHQTLQFNVVGSGTGADLCVMLVSNVTEAKRFAASLEKTHKKEAVKELVGALMHSINQRLTVITVRAKLMAMSLEKGTQEPMDMKQSLNDIMGLTMQIAQTMDRINKADDFVTESYLDGMDIMDIDKSSPEQADTPILE
jgi:nitrogen-specific signal transduction histidine kinase